MQCLHMRPQAAPCASGTRLIAPLALLGVSLVGIVAVVVVVVAGGDTERLNREFDVVGAAPLAVP